MILYAPGLGDGDSFGGRYKPPKVFKHGKWYKVATYEKEYEQPIFVYESRVPARFFRIVTRRGQRKFILDTGSGSEMESFAATIAKNMFDRMLKVNVKRHL